MQVIVTCRMIFLYCQPNISIVYNTNTKYLAIQDLNVSRRHPFAFDMNFQRHVNVIGKIPCNQLEDNVRLLSQVNYKIKFFTSNYILICFNNFVTIKENVAHINQLYECNQTNAENGKATEEIFTT